MSKFTRKHTLWHTNTSLASLSIMCLPTFLQYQMLKISWQGNMNMHMGVHVYAGVFYTVVLSIFGAYNLLSKFLLNWMYKNWNIAKQTLNKTQEVCVLELTGKSICDLGQISKLFQAISWPWWSSSPFPVLNLLLSHCPLPFYLWRHL
jgi:hypothetical protein